MLVIMILGIVVHLRITVRVCILMVDDVCVESDVFVLGSVHLHYGVAGVICLSSRSFVCVVAVSSTIIVMCTLASAGVAVVSGLMSKPSTGRAFQFALESAIVRVMVREPADPATCLRGRGAVIIVRIASNPAGERRFGVLASIGDKGLLGGLSRSSFAGLSLFILLLEYAYELLIVDIFLGICVDKVKLTSNELICELIPRFRQGGCDNAFE